jgi:hypothetical protein
MTAVTATEDPADFSRIARLDWLVPRRWKFLHAVREQDWTDEHRDDMAFTWQVEHPVRLACGRVASALFIPGLFSRGGFGGGLPRCKGCCRAFGGPTGNGSPKNSDEWRKILGLG